MDELRPRTDEISALSLATALVRARRLIASIALAGSVVSVAPLLLRKPGFTSRAVFVVQGGGTPSGLAGLAGQLGVGLAGMSENPWSPQLVADLVKSNAVLTPVVEARYPVVGDSGRALADLLGVSASTPELRRELAIRAVTERVVRVGVSRSTGAVTVTATTRWPAVSADVVRRLLDELDSVSLRVRRAQAAADRRFGAERLTHARDSLRRAEDQLQVFLQSNRSWQFAPDLALRHARLERDVALWQSILVGTMQAYEEALAREMRRTPTVVVVEPPVLPASPDSRGRLRRAVVGLIGGMVIGVLLALVRLGIERRRAAGDPEVGAFERALVDLGGDVHFWRRAAARGTG